jgi:hypothetical protein
MVNKKKEMIESLNDIETTFGIMNIKQSITMNSLDFYWTQLNAKVESLDANTEMYKLISTYVQNTSVHGFKLSILDIFKVEREGEAERYKKIKKLPNRQLLWHGSRGMFGRGIYFADMVSKSANYCQAINHGNIGLLALRSCVLRNESTFKLSLSQRSRNHTGEQE